MRARIQDSWTFVSLNCRLGSQKEEEAEATWSWSVAEGYFARKKWNTTRVEDVESGFSSREIGRNLGD